MSQRRQLNYHRHQLMEIRDIMNSMKNLAYLETRKITRYLSSQQKAVNLIELAATDLLRSFPELQPKAEQASTVIILLGTERGFCGNFNEALLERLNQYTSENDTRPVSLIAIGSKLEQFIQSDERIILSLHGASVAEETIDVLNDLMEQLGSLELLQRNDQIKILYHDPATKQVVMQSIFPPFIELSDHFPRHRIPPVINLEPAALFKELTDHYLFSLLYKISYASLMAENDQRIDHLQTVLRRIDEKTSDLTRKINAVWQEEIVEEIEIILLNTMPARNHPK